MSRGRPRQRSRRGVDGRGLAGFDVTRDLRVTGLEVGVLAHLDVAAHRRVGDDADAVLRHHEITRNGCPVLRRVALSGRNLALAVGLVPAGVARSGEGLVVAPALQILAAGVVLDGLGGRTLVVVHLEVAGDRVATDHELDVDVVALDLDVAADLVAGAVQRIRVADQDVAGAARDRDVVVNRVAAEVDLVGHSLGLDVIADRAVEDEDLERAACGDVPADGRAAVDVDRQRLVAQHVVTDLAVVRLEIGVLADLDVATDGRVDDRARPVLGDDEITRSSLP